MTSAPSKSGLLPVPLPCRLRCCGLVAGMIISYFHMTVGITILAVETIQAIIGFGCKLYYNKKF